MTAHFQISATVSESQIELLSDIFSEAGALAVTMIDAKDQPLFHELLEENPLWAATTVQALFDSALLPEHIVDTIKKNHTEFSDISFYVEKVKNKNWALETQKQFHPQQFGSLWICPQWEKQSFQKLHSHTKNSIVFIEPGLAFGTGAHPTTQLCLTWLATHALKNKTIIDYGCGSGILALAACALGAKTVFATDHDPQALQSTANNEKYNSFKTKLQLVSIDAIRSARADIIVANILANTLINLASQLTELLLPKGKLILSGILANDAKCVIDIYQYSFKHISTLQKEEWVLIEFEKIR